MRVEFLWWEGCPSHPEALEELREVLRSENLDPELIERREIETDEEAVRERFPGSPTIRIDGEDAIPAGEVEPFSLTCRVYRLRDGRYSATPDPNDLRTAIRRAKPVASRAASKLLDKEEGMTLAVGEKATSFTLPDTDGQAHSLPTGQVAVVVFTCNHCPYALAWHDRIVQAARDYPDVKFFAINPNDAERYPTDSAEAMRERVERDGGWPLPYLHDESQEVARAYGAKTTPHLFVVDAAGTVRYAGAPDADYRDPSLNAAWLREALDAVLAGEEPSRPETSPVGCSVKWK